MGRLTLVLLAAKKKLVSEFQARLLPTFVALVIEDGEPLNLASGEGLRNALVRMAALTQHEAAGIKWPARSTVRAHVLKRLVEMEAAERARLVADASTAVIPSVSLSFDHWTWRMRSVIGICYMYINMEWQLMDGVVAAAPASGHKCVLPSTRGGGWVCGLALRPPTPFSRL